MKKWEENVRRVIPYTPGEQPDQPDMIKLNTNENPYPPAPGVGEALAALDTEELRLYPDPAADRLVTAVAESYGAKKEQVFVGVGSDDVLAMCFLTFFNGDRPILFPDITYSFYDVWAELFRIPYERPALNPDFHIRKEDYFRENGGIIFPNPNAPTGVEMPLCEIREILGHNRDVVVIVDEAYVDFGGESAACLLGRYDNLLVVGTFSKSRSLAGARLGYAVGSPALIADLNTVKFSFNPYNINRLTLLAGEAALADAPYFARCCTQVAAVRDETAQALRALGFTVTDSKTNFLFAGAHPAVSGGEYYAALRQSSILVRHFTLPRIENWVRITVGTAAQMQRLVDVTKQILDARHSAAR